MASWQPRYSNMQEYTNIVYKIYKNGHLAYAQAICWLFHWMPISPCLIFCHLNLNYMYVNKFQKKPTYQLQSILLPRQPCVYA